jgi:hypothetical protein
MYFVDHFSLLLLTSSRPDTRLLVAYISFSCSWVMVPIPMHKTDWARLHSIEPRCTYLERLMHSEKTDPDTLTNDGRSVLAMVCSGVPT